MHPVSFRFIVRGFNVGSVVVSSVFGILLATGCSKRSGGASSGGSDSATPAPAAAPVPASPELLSEGAEIFQMNCALCHTDGSGSPAAPPLIGSAVVAESGEAIIRSILYGRQGQSIVDGKLFNGIMPAQATLSDKEIAAVVTYVRKQFGGVDSTVKPSDVAALR